MDKYVVVFNNILSGHLAEPGFVVKVKLVTPVEKEPCEIVKP
jgi:hypothetical protein